VKRILDVIDFERLDNKLLQMVSGEDAYKASLVLLLKRPNRPIVEGFYCCHEISVSGMALYGLSVEKRRGDFLEMLGINVDEAKLMVLEKALPFIEDGCVKISSSIYGPWTNLMSGGAK